MGVPLHKPYPYSLYRFSDSSILGTNGNEMFGEMKGHTRMKSKTTNFKGQKKIDVTDFFISPHLMTGDFVFFCLMDVFLREKIV